MKRVGLAFQTGLVCLAPMMLQGASFKLEIPPSIASVVDSNQPAHNSLPDYILIQDIHRHPEAQANIAAVLLHAYRRLGVRSVYLEGAYAGQTIQPAMSVRPLRDRLNDGDISGAEMAASMIHEDDFKLEGLEDPALYKENVKAYQASQNQLSQALQEIKTARLLQKTLDLTNQRLTSEQLRRLELLARLKLKPSEYAELLEDEDGPSTSEALAQALQPANHFYQVADERSVVFIENILQDHTAGPKALIIGGFHTTKMAEALRKAGKSFVVLSPRVTESGYDELYARGLQETISALKLR